MKKALFAFAILAFVACNNEASTETKTDTTAVAPAADTTAAPAAADTTKKDSAAMAPAAADTTKGKK